MLAVEYYLLDQRRADRTSMMRNGQTSLLLAQIRAQLPEGVGEPFDG